MISTCVRECPCCNKNIIVSIVTLDKVYEVALSKHEPEEETEI